jgi:hypothetical protein
MVDFNKTTINAVVPAYVKEEGTVINQTPDFVVFKTKKRRSSRGLVRHLSTEQIISINTNKSDETTIIYLEPSFPIEYRNIEFDKVSSSNFPGFVNIKHGNGVLTMNKKFMRVTTETSTAEKTLKKAKGDKKEKKDKKDKK